MGRVLLGAVAALLAGSCLDAQPTTSAECLLKVEGPLNGMMAPVSDQYNSKPVWKLVDPATGVVAATDPVMMFYNSKSLIWNIGPALDETADIYGYAVLTDDMVCPDDGTRIWAADADGAYVESGYIYRVMGVDDGVCSPVKGTLNPAGADSGESADTVSGCARLLTGTAATAISVVGGKCFTSAEAAVALDNTGDAMSCVKSCNLLPGSADVYGGGGADRTAVAAGDGTSPLECAAAAFATDPTFGGSQYTAAACLGVATMETVNIGSADSVACFIGDNVNLGVAAVRDTTPLPKATPAPAKVTTSSSSSTTTSSNAVCSSLWTVVAVVCFGMLLL
eukprot:CAMPEP_0113852908 /NCGR_PEP_ID=MMETSP0372-20130328/5905_1 /TAXON_ID=340204 /ORGANISM="Lankesteria abbotti" /LENGTH=336 /DNA_ID=CAMNT_0000824777 /DNA_START=1638 /DNA_END=2648 /DNA_ORIENTATION=+ /assembly_acc=CAM_ASM_000359